MTRVTPFILASASPRRKSLLLALGIKPKVCPANIDETRKNNEKPRAYVRRMAWEKACKAASTLHPSGAWILAADTIVVCGTHHILGKPRNRQEAKSFLKKLSGRKHQVMTSVCMGPIHQPVKQWANITVASGVVFRKLSDYEIEFYLDSEDWRDKAGGYGIQDKGSFLVHTIAGSYTNIIGLPLEEVGKMLKKHGVL